MHRTKKFRTDLLHMNFPHGSTAQDFPHIYTSARNDRRIFRTRIFYIFFCTNKSCLNFNKIVFIETIGKKSLKNVRKKFKNVWKILCGQFLKGGVQIEARSRKKNFSQNWLIFGTRGFSGMRNRLRASKNSEKIFRGSKN